MEHARCEPVRAPAIPYARLAALALGLAPAAGLAQEPPPAPVRVDALRREMVEERALVTGAVRAARRALVASREPGLVLEIAAREGQRVVAGAVLARLDGAVLELELAVLEAQERAAAATLEQERSRFAQAQSDLEALRKLAQGNAAQPKELSDAESSAAAARARTSWAESELSVVRSRAALHRRRLEDLTVAAPFAGTVIAMRSEQGEWLERGAPLLELTSSDELEAWLEVPQQYWPAARAPQAKVELALEALGLREVLDVARVVGDVNPNARTFVVIATLPVEWAALGRVAPGMSLSAWVGSGEPRLEFTAHRDAIGRNANGAFVYAALGTPGQPVRAVPQAVEVLFQVGTRVVVRGAGLAEGTPLVIEGNERLFPGAPLAPLDAGAGGERGTGTGEVRPGREAGGGTPPR
jgi:RND family efflux transporter MFP subunit